MTTTIVPTTTDWYTHRFAVITARPFPSLDQPTYATTGHSTEGCPAIGDDTLEIDQSLAGFMEANEHFDGEVRYLTPWPCPKCVAVDTHAIGFEARRDLPQGTGTPRAASPTDPQADAALAEAKAYATDYAGTFEFMLDMRTRARKSFTLTPKMVSAILRCKAADVARATRQAPASTPSAGNDEDARRATLAPNAFGGICTHCRTDVAAGAGRREKVSGSWKVLHATTTECGAAKASLPAEAPRTPEVALPNVPAGKYAIEADAGHLSFYSVRSPEDGRWQGYTFVDLLIGSPGDWRRQAVPRGQQATILRKIAADPQAASARYGHEFTCCGACDAPLSLKRSRDAGYGEVCAAKRGWAW